MDTIPSAPNPAPRRLEVLAHEQNVPAYELAGVMALRHWDFATEVTVDQLDQSRDDLNALKIG